MTADRRISITPDDFHAIISTSIDGFLLVDLNGNILETNDSYCQMMGYTRDDLLKLQVSSIDAIDNRDDVASRFELIIQSGSLKFETRHRHHDGTVIDVEVSANYSPAHGGSIFSFVRDVSSQKRTREIMAARLRLLEYSLNHSLHELLRETLDEAEALTGSCIGFYHDKDPDSQMLTLQAWSSKTTTLFCKAEGTGSHYPIAQAGVWVDCVHERRPVIHNDYASLPHRKGLPEGHAAVIRELVVPIFRHDKIVAIVGIGNKPTDYTHQDVEVMIRLADLAWDIAERKRAEEALSNEKTFLRSLIDAAEDCIYIKDRNGVYLACNKASEQLIGLSESEQIGKTDFDLFDHDIAEAIAKEDKIVLENGETARAEVVVPYLKKGTVVLDTVKTPIYGPDKQPLGLVGISRDVTDRKRTEEALQKAHVQLELMTAAVPGVVYQFMYTSVGEWQFVYVSDGLKDLYEIEPDEALQDHNIVTGCIVPEDRVSHRESVENASRKLSLWVHEHRILTPGGRLKWVRGQAVPQRNEDGSVLWNGLLIDVTDRKRMEEELRQAKTDADSANRAKSDFLANMSHELRNPMNGVLGMTQLLEITELNEDQREFVTALKLSGRNLLSLINDILDLAKIDAGKIIIEPAELSLLHCINDVVLMQKSVIFGKRLTLGVDVSEDIPQFMVGDQLRIKQILHNLIGNAAKFTSQGGITVSAQLLEQQDASLFVQIAVRDTGIGISAEALDKIFKPFEQENGTTSRTYGGTGLGLAISRHLAELMGGCIAVESTPGTGSCFKVTLPFSVFKEGIATQEISQNAAVNWEGPPLRILLVDDDQVNITFGVSLLRKLGHEVIAAAHGRECFAHLEQGPFDLVLMDINMPEMNGEEALREIRRKEQETQRHQRVIALTAYSLRGDREHFLVAGFDGYVAKPMAGSDLIREMKRVIGEGTTEA